MHLKDGTKMLHKQFRANEDTKHLGVEEFLKALRQYYIPFTSKETLWNEFQAICQTRNGRTLPIQDIANKSKQYQMQLPRISNWQCYHQLLEAMDAPLLQAVRLFINEDMEWDKLIEQCEIHDSVRKINKYWAHSSSRPHQRPRLQSKPYTPMPPSNFSFKPNQRFDRNRKPTPSTSRFTKLTQQERDDLTKKGACFWCRKPGRLLKDCADRKRKISSAAGTLDDEPPSDIKTAAQPIVQKAAVSPTKGLGAMPVLDSVKEHLLVTTKVNDQIAKTLVDQQTAGADLISSTSCTVHKIPLHKMNPLVILQMTIKGWRESLTHYVIVQLDWLGYVKE